MDQSSKLSLEKMIQNQINSLAQQVKKLQERVTQFENQNIKMEVPPSNPQNISFKQMQPQPIQKEKENYIFKIEKALI